MDTRAPGQRVSKVQPEWGLVFCQAYLDGQVSPWPIPSRELRLVVWKTGRAHLAKFLHRESRTMTCVQFLLSNGMGGEGTTGWEVFSQSTRGGQTTGRCLHGASRVPTGPVDRDYQAWSVFSFHPLPSLRPPTPSGGFSTFGTQDLGKRRSKGSTGEHHLLVGEGRPGALRRGSENLVRASAGKGCHQGDPAPGRVGLARGARRGLGTSGGFRRM